MSMSMRTFSSSSLSHIFLFFNRGVIVSCGSRGAARLREEISSNTTTLCLDPLQMLVVFFGSIVSVGHVCRHGSNRFITFISSHFCGSQFPHLGCGHAHNPQGCGLSVPSGHRLCVPLASPVVLETRTLRSQLLGWGGASLRICSPSRESSLAQQDSHSRTAPRFCVAPCKCKLSLPS